MATPLPGKTDEYGIWLEPRRTFEFLRLMCAIPFLFLYGVAIADYAPKGYRRPY